ncbi:MAG: hypothetical protein ACYDIE_11560 [Candidatus Krumholzibacteriia bacterium]
MPWHAEAEAVLGLTRAAREALGRGDLDALATLLDERGVQVRRLGAAAGDLADTDGLAATLAEINAEESALAAALRAGLAETGQVLGRISTAPSGIAAGVTTTWDRRA